MEPHPYGWLSLLPPIVAIVLAVITRRAVLSLLLGVFAGALITTDLDPVAAVHDFFEVHLWPTLIDPGKMRVFAFTLLMGAMVGVISRGGGMQGLVDKLSPLARSRRGGQLTTWLLGWVIFFDDYANTILLGSTLRPVCDRLNISREKLAYLVDSTAAPIASLALISTWVAVELDYIREGLAEIDQPSISAMEVFVSSIPYRFYVIGALVFVPILAITGRDFGPMRRAEQARLRGERTPGEIDLDPDGSAGLKVPAEKARWYNAIVPIIVTLSVVVWLLYELGTQTLVADGVTEFGLRDVFGAADSTIALQYGSLGGLVVAGLLCRIQRLMDFPAIIQAAGQGAKVVLPALAILWCASSLSRQTGSKSVEDQASESFEFQDHRLYTGNYLENLFFPDDQAREGNPTIQLLPTAVFVLAGILAFATGTSFGTMGILMPMVIGLVGPLLSDGGEFDSGNPIFLACVASVLAGAVFGDHCSPISDTTILSSQASACDHMAHVVTQMPYAVCVGVVTIVLGTLPIGFGVPVWLLLPVQVASLILIVRLFGQAVETTSELDS